MAHVASSASHDPSNCEHRRKLFHIAEGESVVVVDRP